MTDELEPALVALLEEDPGVHVLLVGRGSESCAASIAAISRCAAGRVHAAGELPPGDVAPALHACDVLIQPYPDGVTTRRTSVMAGLAAAAAVVTTDGPLTEQVWRATEAARLVPISAAGAMRDAVLALLDNAAERKAQAARGKCAYDDWFAIEHTVDALLSA
jgi:glycosyltransferase involved in cell wall biosynthesis